MPMSKTKDAERKPAKSHDRGNPRDGAGAADWHSLALLHHDQIRAAFMRALNAPPGGSRLAALKGLAVLLNGHSLAEEIVLYPVLASQAARAASTLYQEQSGAKVEMAMLEQLDPLADDWANKIAEIKAAVEEHMREEEERWFTQIKASGANQAKLTARYREEFDRYTRTGALATNAVWDGPALRV
jgi:erythromycin esterase-like protein